MYSLQRCSSPIVHQHTRIPPKPVNSFIFVRFSQVQKLLSNVKRWLKKAPSNRCFLSCKRHTAAALSTRCYSSRVAFGSVVSALRVHFLTLVSNLPISQRATTARISFLSFRCARIQFAAVVPVVSSPVVVSGCKVKTSKPTNQTFRKKVVLKNLS